jgi:hypothetical protein
LAIAAIMLVAAGALATTQLRATDARDSRVAATRQAPRSDSLRARFAVLSRAHSNRCGMPASALDAMPPGARLQGACCFPMDYRSYVNQVRELRRYAGVDVVPKDPYDIPVSLAKLLIGYQSIKLTSEQRRTYNRAIPLSETKGPCCCPCWRWTAFGGQAKYLITRRHWSAKQVAALWGHEEGCGGPSHKA